MPPSFMVLGDRGMLGHVVVSHLRDRGHIVLTSAERYGGSADDRLIRVVAGSRADIIVNCAGVNASRRVTDTRLFLANSLLPLHLAAVLDGRVLIHASTDGVFRGDRGPYRVSDIPDSVEPYGLSKRLGEACLREPGVFVLRTSVVGPETGTYRGLLAWFLSQAGPVEGWVDHRWNGITTLQWAAVCRAIALGESAPDGHLHQPATSEVVSKYELLNLFSEVFGHPVAIRPVKTSNPCDQSLVPTIEVPSLVNQLRELRRWMERRAAQ